MQPQERKEFEEQVAQAKTGLRKTKDEIRDLLEQRKQHPRKGEMLVAFLGDTELREKVREDFERAGLCVETPQDASAVEHIINTQGNGFPLLVDLPGLQSLEGVHDFRRPLVVLMNRPEAGVIPGLNERGIPWIVPPLDSKVVADVLRLKTEKEQSHE